MAVGYVPTRYPAGEDDPVTPVQAVEENEQCGSSSGGLLILAGARHGSIVHEVFPPEATGVHIGTYQMGQTMYWHRVQIDMEKAAGFPLPLCIGNDWEIGMLRVLVHLRAFPSVRTNVTMDSDWYTPDIQQLTDKWVSDGLNATREGVMIEECLVELRDIIFRVHHHQQRTEPDRRRPLCSWVGHLGTYRLHDRDYWMDVDETLNEAQELDFWPNTGDIREQQVQTALTYLHSFPSVRGHLTLRAEWHEEGTHALTDQWFRDELDSYTEGLLIEYWLNKLRILIRGERW